MNILYICDVRGERKSVKVHYKLRLLLDILSLLDQNFIIHHEYYPNKLKSNL